MESQQRYAWPDQQIIGDVLTFSKQVVFTRLSWYVYSNADFAIVGRVLAAPLGMYQLAWNFANLPIEKLTTLVLRVTPAFFARWSVDVENLKRKFVLLTEAMAVVLFPIVLGLAILSEDLIALAAGSKWSAAVRPQQLLMLSVLIRSVATLAPQILTVIGATRISMWNSIATAIILVPGFYVGTQWGVEGVAAVGCFYTPSVRSCSSKRASACLACTRANICLVCSRPQQPRPSWLWRFTLRLKMCLRSGP